MSAPKALVQCVFSALFVSGGGFNQRLVPELVLGLAMVLIGVNVLSGLAGCAASAPAASVIAAQIVQPSKARQPAPSPAEAAVRLEIGNALWGQRGRSFQDPFLDTLAENYGAGLHVADFARAEEALRLINKWAADQTEGRIAELLPPGAVDGEMTLVLSNAISFKAACQHPFSQQETYDGTFTRLDRDQVTMPMMVRSVEVGYAERAGLRAVELPYAGGELSMVILLPLAGTFTDFAQGPDAGELEAILGDLRLTDVRLTLPKFRIDAGYTLKEALVKLGMAGAFNNADFSGIDGTRELFIDEVYHHATIRLDEAGSEATAASSVVLARQGLAVEQEVTVDQPFLFLIRDIPTGAILFLGHVVDPAA